MVGKSGPVEGIFRKLGLTDEV